MQAVILVATATGAIMVPGKPSILAKMLTPRWYLDYDHGGAIAAGAGTAAPHPPSRRMRRDC